MRLLLEELTRAEAREAAPQALVVLPTGAIEQHGPHLPVGVDTFSVTHIARAAASLIAKQIPILVAPTLPFGSSHHHLPFGGTMSLATETYYRVLVDLAESLIVGGVRRIFILNGHGGNDELIQLVARDVALKHPAHLAAASYWTIARDVLNVEEPSIGSLLPGHSGIFETSTMLALHPELVREPRPHRELRHGETPQFGAYRAELHGAWQAIDGFSDSPDLGTADQGERYLAVIVREVAQAFAEFYERTQRSLGPV